MCESAFQHSLFWSLEVEDPTHPTTMNSSKYVWDTPAETLLSHFYLSPYIEVTFQIKGISPNM